MENYSYNSYPDSGDSSPRSREIDFENPPPWEDNQNPQAYKAKFMCSYGGKIHPRPHDNQLAYIGGETKILAADRTIKFASMISKLAALCGDNDVSFKYQLPGEDLDALISVTNDDDLEHMMNEYDRLYRASAKPARMRLFLFPAGTTSSFGSEGSKSDRDRFVDALNSGPSHVTDSKKIANNVDFLFGLEKGVPIPPQKIPESVAVPPPPPPDYHVADDRAIGSDRVVYSDHGLNPVEIQRQLQRLQIREQQQQQHQHQQQQHHEQPHMQEAIYLRKSDDNLTGGVYMPPASLPVQQTTSFVSEKQIPAPNYAGNVTTTHVQPEQPVYMISAHTAAPGTTTVYHHHVQPGSAQPQMIRQVAGQSGQQYYQNMQRMAPGPGPGPDVYREQPVYNMVVPPQQTQAPPPMSAPPPSLSQMGVVRPGGGGGVAVTDTGYTQVAYDSGVGRQVYYTAPGGGMVVPPQYQGVGVGVAVSGGGEMRHAGSGGGLSQEGKVNKVSQTSV